MKTTVVKSALILSLILLTGFSKIELHQAESDYEEARTSKNEQSILAALKLLATLDPGLYLSKLDEAKFAVTERQKAKSLLADNNLYLSYLAIHDSYRKLSTNESKEVLLKVGGQLRYLLNVQSNLVKSFEYLPTSLSAIVSKYQNQPVLEWDVIKVNRFIEQLGLADKYISKSLAMLKREKAVALLPELTQWQLAIQIQLNLINEVEHFLINIALSSSATALQKLNTELTNSSTNLLSFVREGLAQETMQPHFIKAKKSYQHYYNLNENLSLASSAARRNTHAAWYKEWNNIEKDVLQSIAPFSSYPASSSNREHKLRSFINTANKIKPNFELGFSSLSVFMMQYENAYNVIDRLDKDRMLLSYGQSII